MQTGFSSFSSNPLGFSAQPYSAMTSNPMFAGQPMLTGMHATTGGFQASSSTTSLGFQSLAFKTPGIGQQSLMTQPGIQAQPTLPTISQPGFQPALVRTTSTFTQPTGIPTAFTSPGFSQTGMALSQPTGFISAQPTGFASAQPTGFISGQPAGFAGFQPIGFTGVSSGLSPMQLIKPFTSTMLNPIGTTGAISGGLAQLTGTTGIKYQPTTVREGAENTTISSIFATPQLANKSVEEARLEDYKSRASPSMTTSSSMTPAPSQSFSVAAQSFLQAAAAQPFQTTFNKPVSAGLSATAFQTQPTQASLFQTSSASQPSSFISSLGSPTRQLGVQPAQPLFSSQLGTTGIQPSSLFSPSSNPSSLTPSIFASPPQTKQTSNPIGGGSLFTTSQPGTSLFSTSLLSPQGKPPAQTSMFTVGSPSIFVPPTSQPLVYSPSTPLFNSTTQGQYPSAQPPVTSPYRDSHGLSWLYPNENIEQLLNVSRRRTDSGLSESTSIIERLLKNSRSDVRPTKEANKYQSTSKFSAPKRVQKLLDELSLHKKLDLSIFQKRESFDKLKFEPYSSREDSTFFIRSAEEPVREHGMIEVYITAFDTDQVNITMTIFRSTLVREVLEKAASRVPSFSADRVQLVLKSRVLREDLTLAQAGVQDKDTLELVMSELEKEQSELADAELLPKLTTSGYSLYPGMVELARMTLYQLKNVNGFTISNQHGKIEFEGKTDVTKLDIDSIVQVEANSVCVYPDQADIEKPKIGSGLNKPAKVTLYGCKPKKPISPDDFLMKIKKYCKDRDCEFLSFDSSSGVWEFRVKHF